MPTTRDNSNDNQPTDRAEHNQPEMQGNADESGKSGSANQRHGSPSDMGNQGNEKPEGGNAAPGDQNRQGDSDSFDADLKRDSANN